jgi:glycosyltransferase involved in cell wall biosynthesis
MPPRILLLITDLKLGGTPAVVRELAIRLRAIGEDVEVACLAPWGPVADQLRDRGVPVHAINASGPTDILSLPRLIHLIRQRGYSTVFSFLMHANAMAAAASLRLPDVRWIQSIQTTQPWPRWHWAVQRLARRAAELIVVPSPSVARAAMAWAGVPQEQIIVIPNAIDPAEWADFQSTVPAGNSRPYPVVFLGRLDPVKDVPTLVAAVATLRPLVHLHVYGEGADRERIERTIAQLNAPVTLHGATASPQSALQDAGLLVLPSLAEGFGLVLIEAMAAGVPVLATRVAGICDVVRDGETGLLVPPSDAGALAATIRQLIENPTLRQRLITAAKLDVQSRFTWDAVIGQYAALLG